MKTYRYISILLFSCFAVFLGHNLIPHHHHSEVVNVPVSGECPLEHGDHRGNDADTKHHPIHCHAFNDVVFDKYQPPQFEPRAKKVPNMITAGSPDSREPVVTAKATVYYCLKIPDPSLDYLGAISLRAPPVKA